jgi:hypothetical protein
VSVPHDDWIGFLVLSSLDIEAFSVLDIDDMRTIILELLPPLGFGSIGSEVMAVTIVVDIK